MKKIGRAFEAADKVDSILYYVGDYLREQRSIQGRLEENDISVFSSREELVYRLKQIDRVLKYLLNKQAEYLQVIQQNSIEAVTTNWE